MLTVPRRLPCCSTLPAPIANAFELAALTEAQRETYKLDGFYEKATEVEDWGSSKARRGAFSI